MHLKWEQPGKLLDQARAGQARQESGQRRAYHVKWPTKLQSCAQALQATGSSLKSKELQMPAERTSGSGQGRGSASGMGFQ